MHYNTLQTNHFQHSKHHDHDSDFLSFTHQYHVDIFKTVDNNDMEPKQNS